MQDEAKRSQFKIRIGIKVKKKKEDSTNIINRTEIVKKKVRNFGKEVTIQINEEYRTPNGHDQERNCMQHIVGKVLEVQNKNRVLKCIRKSYEFFININPLKLQKTSQHKI